MKTVLGATQSACRECRRLILARIIVRGREVWLEKVCPDHGPQEARVHGDAEAYRALGRFRRRASVPLAHATPSLGCPDSCGLCPEHEQHVCLPILEITDHCNLECPICLVANPGTTHRTRAEVVRMLDALIRTEGQIDVLTLSGGEPLSNPHFRDILAECLSRPEILRVSVSTNGLALERNPDLLRFLAGNNVVISLQFDGLDPEACRRLRGRPLVEEKRRLIDRCAALDAPMSLTATVAAGVNDTCPAEVAGLLFEYDHILSAMFQPAAYAGRAAALGRPANAVTIPEVVAALRGAARGTVGPEDFSPLPCSHPACFSLAFYLRLEQGSFVPVKSLVSAERYLELIRNRAIFGTDADSFEQVRDAATELWAGIPPAPEAAPAAPRAGCAPGSGCGCNPFLSAKALRAVKELLNSATHGGYSPRKALAAGERAVKSIFIHQFMDPDTFDLARARQCCQVYPQPDGRLIPVCIRNCLRRPA